MNRIGLQQIVLQTRLRIVRFGMGNGVGCLLFLLGYLAWLWLVPRLHAHTTSQQQAIVRARAALDAAPLAPTPAARPIAEERLAQFYDRLGERRYAEQQIKVLFALAAKTGLVLSQAEYRPAFEQQGRYHTYQILLPVKGPYLAIRQFCEQTLLAIPFASLDDISFKRESVGNARLEARLRFTLYLAEPGAPLTASDAAAGQGGAR